MKTKELDTYITKIILKPQYIDIDVIGAPFEIGDTVLILNNPNNDNTFNEKLSDLHGIVEYFEYNCGCGQTFPHDPMIGVRLKDKRISEFWKEELQLVKP